MYLGFEEHFFVVVNCSRPVAHFTWRNVWYVKSRDQKKNDWPIYIAMHSNNGRNPKGRHLGFNKHIACRAFL